MYWAAPWRREGQCCSQQFVDSPEIRYDPTSWPYKDMMDRTSAQPRTELNLRALRQASYLYDYDYDDKFSKVDFKALKGGCASA